MYKRQKDSNGKKFMEHLVAVCYDRTLLFDLRQVGTKRAIKAMARLQEPLQADRLIVALRAEINYSTYISAVQALNYYLDNFQEKDRTIIKQNNQKTPDFVLLHSRDFFQRFINILQTTAGLFKEITFTNTDYRLLLDSVFTLDENKQREIIDGIIAKKIEPICKFFFKEIVVLDSEYIEKAIIELALYLKKD